jgi:ubiquitin carboxyl-terminal hydrolase L3
MPDMRKRSVWNIMDRMHGPSFFIPSLVGLGIHFHFFSAHPFVLSTFAFCLSSMSPALRWVPLESNPELYSAWSSSMGLDTSKYAFVDIYGLDDELLSMVPQPVEAVLCLFPVTKEYETKRLEEDSHQEPFVGPEKDGELIWFKQTIGNACGTIGLLHSISNTSARDTLSQTSPLAELLKEALPLNATDRAAYLHAHTSAAASGQTAAPSADDPVDLHFVSFVRDAKSKQLYELDGRRRGPVNRGVPVPDQNDLLKVATQWVADNYVSS